MSKILITGSSGKFGKQVILNLLKNGIKANNISALAREESKVSDLKELGIEILIGDYGNYSSLVEAFKGVEKLLFVSSSEMLNIPTHHNNIIKASKESGVKYIAYTSLYGNTHGGCKSVAPITQTHYQTEVDIEKSGIPYTILLNGLYSEVLSEYFIQPNLVFEHGIFFPGGQGLNNFTTRFDLAEAAANILSTNGHQGKKYILTNDESNSIQDVATYLSEISGKTISYTSPDIETYKKALAGYHVPEQAIFLGSSFGQAISDSEFKSSATDLPRILNRKPESLKEFILKNYKLNK